MNPGKAKKRVPSKYRGPYEIGSAEWIKAYHKHSDEREIEKRIEKQLRGFLKHNLDWNKGGFISTEEFETEGFWHPKALQKLLQKGRLPAEKVANRWLLPKAYVAEFAKTYEGRRGRPRKKRKYTRRKDE